MNKRKFELVCIDSVIIIFAWLSCMVLSTLRPGSIYVSGEFTFSKGALLFICTMASRVITKNYSTVWRYANVRQYLILIVADSAAGVIYLGIGRLFSAFYIGFGYSIVVIMEIIILTMASRFVYQVYYAYKNQIADNLYVKSEEGVHKIKVAIVGAGNVGATLAEELLRNPKSHYVPYCFIDKDVQKMGLSINGLPIFAENAVIVDKIRNMPVQEIIIALPDLDSKKKNKLYDLYKQTDCKVKLYDYPLGSDVDSSARRTLREFRIEDLLFRESIEINNPKTKAFYKGKRVLVTGGGGSIGSELCRQIAQYEPESLVIFDIYENNAYEIQQELLRKYGDHLKLDVLIGSVRDYKRLDEVFEAVRPQIVFHAAAHKHVPLMQRSGVEALKNNVFGTYNVANFAEKYNVENFLLISTDKAVNPTNIMGATKRLCEMIVQCREDSKTTFSAVRFGNVLGSNGSVIPLFKKQIEAGGPVTLTDKRIIRYFMTIPEAVQLVLETAAMANNGELFALDMGKPVKILDLAENMIRLSGLKPYEDIDIQEIGLRPGEKLYEELLMKTEELDKTSNDMIFIERDTRLSREEVSDKLDIISNAIELSDNDSVLDAIRKTVPTFHDPEEVNCRAKDAAEMKAVGL